MICPVMKPASSEARKATRPAVSAGSPSRPRANEAPASSRCAAVSCPNGPVAVLPGPTALTVIPRAANSAAATLVTWSRKAFTRKLGVTLLERTSRRVTLTPAGAVLLEQGRIAVEGVGAAFERARRKGTQAGRLSVAVKPGSGTDLIKTIMQRCARDPRMPRVHILFGHPGGPAAAVRGGAADVAILRTPFDQRGLDTELLLTEPRVAVLPSGH